MVLGSLPATTGSVWAALDRLADRQRVRPWGLTHRNSLVRGLLRTCRRTLGLVLAGLRLLPAVLIAAAVVALAWWLSSQDGEIAGLTIPTWHEAIVYVREDAEWWSGAIALGAVLLGGVLAHLLGRSLQVLRPGVGPDAKWEYQTLSHPAGAAAGWAVLYGAGYFLIAGALLNREDWLDTLWVRALLMTSAVLGLLLVLIVPVWLPAAAVVKASRREVARAITTWPKDMTAQKADAEERLVDDLVARAVSYRCYVSNKPRKNGGPAPRLKRPAGTHLYNSIGRALRLRDDRN
jgi:hypothetical protein